MPSDENRTTLSCCPTSGAAFGLRGTQLLPADAVPATKQAPMTNAELLEIYCFLEAAEESHRKNGAPVTLESVLKKARAEVAAMPRK